MLGLIPRLPVGHIRSRSLAKAKTTPAAGVAGNGLIFPSNGAAPASTLVAFRLTGADLHDAYPATYVWRVRPVQQTGYYTTFFHGPIATFDGNGYYGAHPYPDGGGSGTVHNWEISIEGTDAITDDNANSTVVTKDAWYTQALVVRLVNTDELECKFYWDLTTASTRVITFTTTSNYSGSFPDASPAFTVGDAPWSAGNERLSGTLGQFKIFNTNLSLSDIESEAADMNTIVTSAGQAARWWFKPGFADVDDLTDAVTGKSAAWANANKATLGSQL